MGNMGKDRNKKHISNLLELKGYY